jgi:hypothetical protein
VLLAAALGAIAVALWWNPKIGAAALVVVVSIAAAWVWGSYSGRARRQALQARPDLRIEELHRQFYSDSPITPSALTLALDEIALALDVPRGKLRPSDRFDRELAATPGWEADDDLGVLNELVVKRLGDRAEKVQTVDDYIRLTAGLEGR